MSDHIHLTRNTEFEKIDAIDNGCHGILCAVATMFGLAEPPWNIEMIDEIRELVADTLLKFSLAEHTGGIFSTTERDIVDNGCHAILCAAAVMLDKPEPAWDIKRIDTILDLVADVMLVVGVIDDKDDFYPSVADDETSSPDYCRNCDSTDGIMLCPLCLGGTGVLDPDCEACGGKGHAPCPICSK